MKINSKETIVLTQKEQEFFNDMVDFIDAIYEESEKGAL